MLAVASVPITVIHGPPCWCSRPTCNGGPAPNVLNDRHRSVVVASCQPATLPCAGAVVASKARQKREMYFTLASYRPTSGQGKSSTGEKLQADLATATGDQSQFPSGGLADIDDPGTGERPAVIDPDDYGTAGDD